MAKKPKPKAKTKKSKAVGAVAPVVDPVEFDFKALMAAIDKRNKDKQAAAFEKLREITPELFLAGVTTIIAEYDAAGDSGNIDSLEFLGVDDKIIDNKKLEIFKSPLCDVCWSFLPSGFENNEGGYGTVTIHTGTRKIQIAHHQRYLESDYTETNLDF